MDKKSDTEKHLALRIKLWITILALSFPLAGYAPNITAAQLSRPYSIDDYIQMKWVTSAQISGDGSKVLYTTVKADIQSDRQRQSIWVVSTKGGDPVKIFEVSPPPSFPPAWSPDGKQIAFLSNKEGGTQLWLVKTSGGEASKLTRAPSDVQSFAWSPDGKSIAFVMAASTDTKPDPAIAGQSSSSIPQLHMVDVETKQVRRLTEGRLAPGMFSWSPDGKHIAFTAQGDIYRLALDSGQISKLVERPGQDINPQWSPDGKSIAFFTSYGTTTGARGLSIVSANGGAPRDIYQSFDPGFGSYPPWYFGWSADSKTLYSVGLSRMRQHLYALSPDAPSVRQVSSGGMVYHDFSLSHDGRTMAFLASDSSRPDDIYVSQVEGFKPVRLTNLNPQLNGVAFGQTEAVRWKSRDGVEVEGLLLKPVGYEEGKRYPLLVLMEGTFGSFDFSFTGRVSADGTGGFAFPFQQQLFAGQGYAVLMPNPRGSWGYGPEFSRLALGDFGTGPYNDIMGGVDEVIAKGIADAERIGIMGIYVDGYRAAFALTQTERFKAAVICLPIFNIVSWYGQLGPDANYADRYFGGPPWQIPQSYEKINPVNYAGKIRTPTLLFSLEQPSFPPVQQAREMYTALKRNNVPMEYVVYPSPGIFIGPKAHADLLRRNNAWFARWLKRENS